MLYCLPSGDSAYSEILERLINLNAWQGNPKALVVKEDEVDTLKSLRELEMSGFVLRQSVPSSGHCFVLSTAAAASIRVMRRLNPDSRSCIADVPDPLRVAPRSMTGWECICFLRASGFEWRKAPKVAKRAALEPLTLELVTEQGKRYWYSTAVQVNLS